MTVRSAPNPASIQASNPALYYSMVLAVRAAYESSQPTSGGKRLLVKSASYLLVLGGFGVSVWSGNGLTSILLGFAILLSLVSKLMPSDTYTHSDFWMTNVILDAGFSRAEAKSFIDDFEWDHIQYSEKEIDYLRENAEEFSNA